jgi:hypothetical protein
MVLSRRNKTFQLFNLATKLVLCQHNLREHSIPERRSITHRSEAKGKKKMHLYAHNWICKIIVIVLNMQWVFFSVEVGKDRKSERRFTKQGRAFKII